MVSRSFLVAGAVFLCAFGVVAWFLDRRRGDRLSGPVLLTGLPGVYLCGWASIGGSNWLYLPGGILLGAGYLLQAVQVRGRPATGGMVGGSPGVLTGVQLTAPVPEQPVVADRIRRWSGPASFPSALGQLRVLVPLACLTVSGSTACLRLRPGLLARLLAVTPLSVTPADGAEIFPVGGARTTQGIGILFPDGGWYYFGTPAREEVLAALSDADVNVSWLERQAPARTG